MERSLLESVPSPSWKGSPSPLVCVLFCRLRSPALRFTSGPVNLREPSFHYWPAPWLRSGPLTARARHGGSQAGSRGSTNASVMRGALLGTGGRQPVFLATTGWVPQLAPQGQGIKCAAQALAYPLRPQVRAYGWSLGSSAWGGLVAGATWLRCRAGHCATLSKSLKLARASVSSSLKWGWSSQPCRVVIGQVRQWRRRWSLRGIRKHELLSYFSDEGDPGFPVLSCKVFSGWRAW